jgi:hypothetical protein
MPPRKPRRRERVKKPGEEEASLNIEIAGRSVDLDNIARARRIRDIYEVVDEFIASGHRSAAEVGFEPAL